MNGAELLEQGDNQIDGCTQQSADGDGEYPCRHQVFGDAPTYCREAFGGTDTHDGTGNGMGGADGYLKQFGEIERERTGGFGNHAFEGCHLGYLRTHGLYNLPSSGHRSDGNGGETGECNPVGDVFYRPDSHADVQRVGGYHGCGDDAHHLLRVVEAVARAEECSRKPLQMLEP